MSSWFFVIEHVWLAGLLSEIDDAIDRELFRLVIYEGFFMGMTFCSFWILYVINAFFSTQEVRGSSTDLPESVQKASDFCAGRERLSWKKNRFKRKGSVFEIVDSWFLIPDSWFQKLGFLRADRQMGWWRAGRYMDKYSRYVNIYPMDWAAHVGVIYLFIR